MGKNRRRGTVWNAARTASRFEAVRARMALQARQASVRRRRRRKALFWR